MTGRKPRKPGRPVDPRKLELILEAARRLVFSEGLQAVTMERVAQEAGVSKVTLYARFANRHELLSTLVASRASLIHQALGPDATTREELREGLMAFVRAMKRLIHGEEYRQLMLVLGSIPQSTQDLCALYRNGPEKTIQVLADYLAQAARQGLIDCPNPLESAEMLMGMACGLNILRLIYRAEVPAQDPDQLRLFAGRIVKAFLAMHGAPQD